MSAQSDKAQARTAADAAARRSYGKLVAFLAARNGDVAAAEDALAEAFAAALATWPARGCPTNPEGWLLTVARRRLIDAIRHQHSRDATAAQMRILSDGLDAASTAPAIPDHRPPAIGLERDAAVRTFLRQRQLLLAP